MRTRTGLGKAWLAESSVISRLAPCLCRQHDHLRLDGRSWIEVEHVLTEEAGAAACNAGPDRVRIAGAVDRVERVLAVLIEVKRAGAERIVETSWHAAGVFGRLGLALDHLLGRRPDGPFGLAPDVSVTAPQELRAADIGAIAGGVSVAFDAVKIVVAGIDDNRAGRFIAVVAHYLAKIFRIDLADIDRRDRKFLVGDRPVDLRRLGAEQVVGRVATGQPQRAETDGRAEQKRPTVEKPRPKPGESSPVHRARIGNSTVHDHDIEFPHVLLPDSRSVRHASSERLLPSLGSIGKIGPSLRGLARAQDWPWLNVRTQPGLGLGSATAA